MLIYHNHIHSCSNGTHMFNNNVNKKKKDYKSLVNRKPTIICSKVLNQDGQKRFKKVKKKLSKKNVQFLETLGHKVRHQH